MGRKACNAPRRIKSNIGLVRTDGGRYFLPGGGIEAGEDQETAMIRSTPRPKQQATNPDHSTTFFDSNFIIAGHTHGNFLEVLLAGEVT